VVCWCLAGYVKEICAAAASEKSEHDSAAADIYGQHLTILHATAASNNFIALISLFKVCQSSNIVKEKSGCMYLNNCNQG